MKAVTVTYYTIQVNLLSISDKQAEKADGQEKKVDQQAEKTDGQTEKAVPRHLFKAGDAPVT